MKRGFIKRHDDTDEKNRARIILASHGIYALQDQTIYLRRIDGKQHHGKIENPRLYKIRQPDLYSKTHNLVIEIDGKVHDFKALQTEERNYDYFIAGIKLIVINIEELKSLNKTWDNHISKCLKDLKIVSLAEKQ